MKEIPLTRGYVALVDDADYESLSRSRWCVLLPDRLHVYAQSRSSGKLVTMHRQIMGFPGGDVDHIDGNGLNNQRSNLRVCSRAQNNCHSKMHAVNTSGYRGVTFCKERKLWVAQIDSRGRHYQLGRYRTPAEAARVYDAKAIELHGEFATLNFPQER